MINTKCECKSAEASATSITKKHSNLKRPSTIVKLIIAQTNDEKTNAFTYFVVRQEYSEVKEKPPVVRATPTCNDDGNDDDDSIDNLGSVPVRVNRENRLHDDFKSKKGKQALKIKIKLITTKISYQ